jgi:hypothetical protein
MMLLAVTALGLAVMFIAGTLRDIENYRLERAIETTRDVRWQNILDAIESHERDLEIDAATKRHPSGWDDRT